MLAQRDFESKLVGKLKLWCPAPILSWAANSTLPIDHVSEQPIEKLIHSLRRFTHPFSRS